jgi:hypothetical protein
MRRFESQLLSAALVASVSLGAALLGGGLGLACAGNNGFQDLPGDGGANAFGEGGAAASGLCTQCTTNADCKGGAVCAQFQGDTFCAAACPNEGQCTGSTTCTVETSYAGDQLSVCVPDGNLCGMPAGPVSDGGQPMNACDAAPATACGTLVGPTTKASCTSCTSSSQSTCGANGCYGGWWCDTSDSKCHAPPTSCSGGGGGGGNCSSGGDSGTVKVDAGGPVGGTVGANGGTVTRLLFGVVGDTRPANEDDTSGYPTAIIDQIYTDIAALSPMPTFLLGTGDYQFASPSGSQSAPQIALYMAARAKYSGVLYPAMGNHECTGATASNCGQGNTNGVTSNLTNFISTMLAPIQQTSPYYAVNINAMDGSWTAKFVFIAANAWDSGQSSWLSGVMANKTTYTFVVRHESTGTSGPPGVAPSDSILGGFPYTLLIVGHTHTYEHRGTNEIIIGNGGAPLTGSGNYGFGLISQRSDGALTVDVIDYQSGQADSSFHFVITPGGTITQ